MSSSNRSSRRNAYPQASQATPGQKVYIVDCATCGSFLSSRGMKAVLLLRPHIALYSTDALPVNCSAHVNCSTNKVRPNDRTSHRTCSCLTQTLLCHGCGSPVGYMIVVPCEMCTASSSLDSRTTNNHRFVFHCGVVRAYERLYLPEEPYNLDVLAPPQRVETIGSQSPWNNPPLGRSNHPFRETDELPISMLLNPESLSRTYLPTPPPDELVAQNSLSTISTPSLDAQMPVLVGQNISSPLVVRIPNRAPTTDRDYITHSASDLVYHLNTGDVVYWHHLSRHGEIPACCDNNKVRGTAV